VETGLARLREAVLAADDETALAVVKQLIDTGNEPLDILESGLSAAMTELGRRWNRGEAFLPEVVAAADIFRRSSEFLEPLLAAKGQKRTGHLVVMGTVKGDLHDLGKNIVSAMLRTAGFEVHDLGKDVPAGAFVAAVSGKGPAILGLSALLTTTMMEQRAVIEALREAGLRESVKVLVGGAPVTPEWAAEIGADGHAPNAPQAVELALKLVRELGDSASGPVPAGRGLPAGGGHNE